ncbi:glycosyltransferase [Shewanella frigidimarina]|uniref:glycosyltransferase n=1 Tax=Shewanella frigidimarina TaxID=56812 RepID=UPI003D79E007
MKKNILINASNLHGGGAVAVASSFIHELSLINFSNVNISLLVSSEVGENLSQKNTNTDVFCNYKIMNFYGLSSLWNGLSREFLNYHLVFTVFGPAYFCFSKAKHLFGFAQPWILYPNNPVLNKLNFLMRLKNKFHYFVQSVFFSRADELIVELEHVKKGLSNYSYLKNIPTHIVYSTVDNVFYNQDKWRKVDFPASKADIKLGVIARDYPHKNLHCLLDVKKLLLKKYNLKADFFVTFSSQEWDGCSDEYKQKMFNVGLLTLEQCPSFYSQIDAVVFPTLLECFSATPLESMAMGKKLFSSNLPFIKDCALDYADYFDPLNVESIASSIANYFLKKFNDEALLEEAKMYVQNFSSAEDRAKKYLDLMIKAVNK